MLREVNDRGKQRKVSEMKAKLMWVSLWMLGLMLNLQAATSSIPEEVTSASTAVQTFALTIVGVVATIAIAFVGLSYVKRLKRG